MGFKKEAGCKKKNMLFPKKNIVLD